jgi:hypothetical protein
MGAAASDHEHHSQDHADDGEGPGDVDGSAGDAAEAENGCDDRDDEES